MSVRRFKSVAELESAWNEYKEDCNNQQTLTHDFSSKNSEFVSATLKRSVSFTIEGFCVFAGISRQSFYKSYAGVKKYSDIVTRMREECEVDTRKKFELQVIPSQLAGLWMSKFGYSTKEKTIVASDQVSSFLDALKGKAETVFQDEPENE